MLKDKRILFISPRFFDYEEAIISAIEKNGAVVDFFDERPSNSNWTKGLIRVNSNFLKTKITKYYQNVLKQITGTYDYFLLIKGESIPFFFLKELKKRQPKMERIFYMYDSVVEYPRAKELMRFFDKNISFEYQDAKKYNMHFRPLFYTEEYIVKTNKQDKLYDLCFVGSAHTDRLIVGESLREEAENLGLRTYFYYYTPNLLSFFLKRIFDKNMRSFALSKLSFTKLSQSDLLNLYTKSRVVVDINKPFQNGLGFRTYESLLSGAKIISTNKDYRNYSFYDENRIEIIDRLKPKVNLELLNSEVEALSAIELKYLHIDQWLKDVFLENEIHCLVRT